MSLKRPVCFNIIALVATLTLPLALMEYHCNKDSSVAIKIFELGLKAFPDDVTFALKFLQFLIQLNDESSKLMVYPPFRSYSLRMSRCSGPL